MNTEHNFELNDPFAEDRHCFVTVDKIEADLKEVERKLAKKLGLGPHIRNELLQLSRKGELFEDELVSEWHELYSQFMNWPEADAEEPPQAEAKQEKEAAEAAFCFCTH